MESMLDIALELSEQGLHVIPLGDPYSRPPARLIKEYGEEEAKERWPKTPRVAWKEFQTQAPSDDEINLWWKRWKKANVGIITGVRVVVVDADSDEAVAFMESGEVTRTPWKCITSKGKHYYYQSTDRVSNSVGENKIDIRGKGGYVVGPGSTHFSGKHYEWDINDEWQVGHTDDLPSLTQDDIARINAFNGLSMSVDDIDLSQVKDKADGRPVETGGRNNAAASLTGQYLAQGKSLREIRGLLDQWNNSNNEPLTTTELQTTIASVVTTHQKNHPNKHVRLEPKPKRNHDDIFFTYKQLNDEPQQPPESLWRGALLFRGARLMIAGAPKVGKSNFFLAMGVAAATGRPFLETSFLRPCRVMWLQAEIHKGFIKKRLDRLTHALTDEEKGLLKDNFILSDRVRINLMDNTDMEMLEHAVKQYQPDIIGIDPVINFSTAEENNNGEVHEMLSRVDYLADLHNSAVVLIHHIGKNVDPRKARDPFSAIRGASAFRGWYDSGVVLSGDKRLVICAYELRNDESPAVHGIQFDETAGAYRTVPLEDDDNDDENTGNKETVKRSKKVEDQVSSAINILKSEPSGMYFAGFVSRLMKLIKVSDRRAKEIISAVRDDPFVTIEKDGRQTKYVYCKPDFFDQGQGAND